MLNRYWEIRVYRAYKYKNSLTDDRLMEQRKLYYEPSDDDIFDAIADNNGDFAEVVIKYEVTRVQKNG